VKVPTGGDHGVDDESPATVEARELVAASGEPMR
jgi:hypothetical protein